MTYSQQPPPRDDEPIEVLKGSWIEELGSNWTYAGWCLFALTMGVVGIQHMMSPPTAAVVFLVFGLLTLVWWVLDALDQRVSIWYVPIGIAMIVIGFLPRGFILMIAAWVFYMLRVRES